MKLNVGSGLAASLFLLSGILAAEEFQSADQYAAHAQTAFRQGDYKQAIKFYQKAVKLNTTDPDYRDMLGRSYERQAEQSAFPMALTYKARESFLRAIQLQADNKGAIEDLIELTQQPVGLCGGNLNEASALIDRLAQMDPAEAARQRDYWRDARSEEQRLGQKTLCAPVHVARAVADHVLPHSKLDKSGNAVVAPGLVAPGLVASKFIPGNFSNVATK
jgi:tetratricopeptide (TPR) repeat protein